MSNTPNMRFKGFEGEWEVSKFAQTFNFLKNNSLSRAELNNEHGKALNVHYGDILTKYGEILDVQHVGLPYVTDEKVMEKFSSFKLQNRDIIIVDAAEDETVGKCSEVIGITDQIVLSGLHTIPCRTKNKFARGYLGYYMNSRAYHDQLLPLIQGTKVSSISKKALQNTVIAYPLSIEEQQKIGSYFEEMEEAIVQIQRKCNQLQTLKKIMLQKMFPKRENSMPDFRFQEFTGPWKQYRLSELVSKYNKTVPTPQEGYTRLGIRSHAKGTFHSYVEAGEALETDQMNVVGENNLIVNITFAWEHAVAITNEEDAGKLVSHRFPQFSFKEGVNPDFFRYVILDKRFKYHLGLASPGGAGRNRVLNISEMLKYVTYIPSEDEQIKIAKYLNNLDNQIVLYQRKCDKLKEMKQFMLKNMFVQ